MYYIFSDATVFVLVSRLRFSFDRVLAAVPLPSFVPFHPSTFVGYFWPHHVVGSIRRDTFGVSIYV